MSLPYRKAYYATHPTALWEHAVKQPIQGFWQRGRRGWSDRDVWSMDAHLSRVIIGMVEYLREHGQCYPGTMTNEQWRGDDGILAKIMEGFEAHLALFDLAFLDDENADVARRNLETKFTDGMELFMKHYDLLWD